MFIQQWFKPKLYATANSLDFGSRSVGQVIAMAAVPVLVTALGGWRALFVLIGLVMAAVTVGWLLFGRERVRKQGDGPARPAYQGNPARVLKRHKAIWTMAASQMGAALAFASFMSFYPTFAIDKTGVSLTAMGFIMSLFPIGAVLGTLSAGPLSQRLGRRKPLVWSGGLTLPLLYTGMLWVEAPAAMMALLFAAGVFAMFVPPILSTIAFDMDLEPRELSVALALTRTLFPVGATLGPVFVGYLEEATGSLFLGLSIVAPMAVTLFIGGVFLPETGPKGRAAARASRQEWAPTTGD